MLGTIFIVSGWDLACLGLSDCARWHLHTGVVGREGWSEQYDVPFDDTSESLVHFGGKI